MSLKTWWIKSLSWMPQYFDIWNVDNSKISRTLEYCLVHIVYWWQYFKDYINQLVSGSKLLETQWFFVWIILIHHYDFQWIFYVHAFSFINPLGCHSSIFELHPFISYYICIMIHNIVHSIYFGINEDHPENGQLSSMFVIYFDLLLKAHYESTLPTTILLAPEFQMKECPLIMWHSYIQND